MEIDQNMLIELKKQFTAKKAIKTIFGTLVSIGAMAAVIAMFKNPIKASKGIIKLLMIAGVFMLADKAGDVAENHFDEKVDEWSDSAKEFMKEMAKEGADAKNGTDPNGRNTKQQSEKQRDSSTECERSDSAAEDGEASSSSIWWRRRRKKKGTE